MEKFSESKPYEIIEDIEQTKSSVAVNQKELEKKAIDTIIALVNQANNIASENSSVEERQKYVVENADTCIDKTDKSSKNAIVNYDKLKGMKQSHFWTIGRNKAKVGQTQEVLNDIIDAIKNNANATKALFNDQTKLAELQKKLYGISLMGIASNRIVIREIKLRLENASKEELSELARQELENTVYELEKQLKLEEKIDDINNEINRKIDELLGSQKSFITKSEEQFSNAISELEKMYESLSKTLRDDQSSAIFNLKKSFDENIAHINEKSDELTKSQEAFMFKSKENFSNALSQIREEANAKVAMMKEGTETFMVDSETKYLEMKKQVRIYKIVSIIAIAGSIATVICNIIM